MSQALVRTCVEFDEAAQACIREVWAVAPSILPPLTTDQAGEILTRVVLLFGIAWAWKKIGQLSAR